MPFKAGAFPSPLLGLHLARTFANLSDTLQGPSTNADCCAQDTGAVLSSWGESAFLMPHGLTVDFEGNVWVTDVGLHQAIKFDQQGNQLLTLGKRLEPGSDSAHLCKPTHVSLHVVHAQPDQQRGLFWGFVGDITSKGLTIPSRSFYICILKQCTSPHTAPYASLHSFVGGLATSHDHLLWVRLQ